MQLSNNKILITGGASGIGKGLTERFLQKGNTVIVCGRRVEVLEALQQEFPEVITFNCDLSLETERIRLYEWIATNHPDTNVLINNAGIQQWTQPGMEDFWQKAKVEMATNMEAPLHLIHLFMDHRALNVIINTTSGLSFCPLTKVPVYSATKAFFHSLTLSVRHLMKERGVEVIELIPPAINTDLGGKGLHDEAPPVSALMDAVFQQLESGKNELTFGFSERMAKATPDDLKATFEMMNNR